MNIIKILTLGLVFSIVGMLMFANSADAVVCSKTWNGQTYSYNYSASGSNGTFVFNNWASTQYNVTISVVGKVTTCLSQTDFNKMMSWSYNSDAQAFWNTGLSSWSRNLSCGNTHTYSKVHVPVNGSCGPADGATYASAPSTGLCSVGSASGVTTNASTYSWSCAGQYGGTADQCSADKGNNGGTNNSTTTNNGSQQNPGAPLTAAHCEVSNSVPNLGEEVTLTAIPVGGNGSYSYSWTGDAVGSYSTITVTKNDPYVVQVNLAITSDGVTKGATCAPIEFTLRPVISIVPPITNDQCTLSWISSGLPAGATCKVYEDGVEKVGFISGTSVDAGKKYQIKCTYTPAGIGATATTTVSEIRACVKNPSLIEI